MRKEENIEENEEAESFWFNYMEKSWWGDFKLERWYFVLLNYQDPDIAIDLLKDHWNSLYIDCSDMSNNIFLSQCREKFHKRKFFLDWIKIQFFLLRKIFITFRKVPEDQLTEWLLNDSFSFYFFQDNPEKQESFLLNLEDVINNWERELLSTQENLEKLEETEQNEEIKRSIISTEKKITSPSILLVEDKKEFPIILFFFALAIIIVISSFFLFFVIKNNKIKKYKK